MGRGVRCKGEDDECDEGKERGRKQSGFYCFPLVDVDISCVWERGEIKRV